MKPTYTLTLASGEPLVVVHPMESNGIGNKSSPMIVTVNRLRQYPEFVVGVDLTFRAKLGFQFTVASEFGAAQTYTAVADSVLISGYTHIPVALISEPPSAPKNVTSSTLPLMTLTYSVPDAATSLMLLGASVPNFNDDISWGHAIQQNLINVLSHNASPTPPLSPLVGEMWYDTTSDSLCIFTSNKTFKRIITLQALEAFVTMKTNLLLGQRTESAPVHSDAPGMLGDWYSDNSYMYVCGDQGWRRTATEIF